MYGNFFVNTQISANLRNKLQEYTQSPDKITQKYERIHSFTKRTVRSFRKFEVRDYPIVLDTSTGGKMVLRGVCHPQTTLLHKSPIFVFCVFFVSIGKLLDFYFTSLQLV